MHRLLLLVAVLFAAPAHAEWWEAKTDHFIVYSESSEKEAREFAQKLERFDISLRSLQNIAFKPAESDSHRLTVFRTGDTDDIGQLYSGGRGGSGVAGFYIPNLAGSISFTPAESDSLDTGSLLGAGRDSRTELNPQQVLFHEYAHHFMFQHFTAAYPSWYTEGFAETYATIEFKEDGSFHLGNPPQYRANALFYHINVPVERMLTTTRKPTGEDFYSWYTVGWLLTHYLTFEPSRAGQLKKYLVAINKGTEPAAAAVQAFGDLGKLNREMNRYKSRVNGLPGADVKPANYAPPRVAMRRLTEAEEAIMNVKMRSKRGVDRDLAGGVASDARSVAARYPGSFPVQLALAEAEIDLSQFEPNNLARAEAAADRALALNPRSVEAMVYKGRVYLERGRSDKRQLETARTWFAKAYEADPYNPSPLYYNYLAYYHSGGAIPESALIGLERAYRFAPFDQELRLVLVRQLLAEKKGLLARDILMPLALEPHESKRAKKLNEVAQLIDGQKVDEAYRQLSGEMAEWERKHRAGED
jgi:tetratricopeptide (TPR) repeat protein